MKKVFSPSVGNLKSRNNIIKQIHTKKLNIFASGLKERHSAKVMIKKCNIIQNSVLNINYLATFENLKYIQKSIELKSPKTNSVYKWVTKDRFVEHIVSLQPVKVENRDKERFNFLSESTLSITAG